MGKSYILLLSTALLLMTAGCTREVESSTVQLRLPERLSKVGALADTAPYQHLIINVSGAGISPTITWDWDRHSCEHLAVCAPPTAVTINDVPNGTGRLVQVLAITGWDDNMGTFWYGDNVVTVNGATTAPVLIAPYGGVATISNGQIAGRYYKNVLDAFGAPTIAMPTGTVISRIPAPDPLKPGIIVSKSEMFAGWFSVFGLGEIGLTYELVGYGDMFGGQTVQLNTFAPPATVKVTAPASYRMWDGSMDTPQTAIIGRFGDGALSIPATSMATCVAPAYTYKYKVMGSPFAPIDFPSDLTVVGSGTCTGTPYVNHITFNPAAHDERSIERAGGFEGPFVGSVTMGRFDFVNVLGGGTLTTIDWDYMPDINTSVLDGVRIFVREYTNANYERRDYENPGGGVDCAGLSAKGFVNIGGSITYPLSQFTGDFSAFNSAIVVVCPYKGDKYFTTAVDTRLGSEFEYSVPATSIRIVGPAYIGNDSSPGSAPCTPYRLEGMNGTKRAYLDGSAISISSGNANVQLYHDSYCGSPLSGPVNNGGEYMQFYARSGFPSSLASVSLSASYKSYTTSKVIQPVAIPGTIIEKIDIKGPTTASIKAFECYDLNIEKWHGGTPSIMVPHSGGSGFTVPPDFAFFEEPTGDAGPCDGLPIVSSISMSPSEISKRVQFRYVGSGMSGAISLAAGAVTPAYTITQPGSIVRMGMWAPWDLEVGQCEMVSFMGQDRDGHMVSVGSPRTFTLYDFMSLGGFYSDSGCTSSITDIGFASNDVSKALYYKATSQGSAMIGANDGGSPALIGLSGFTVGPATAKEVIPQPPGLTYNFGVNSYSGSQTNATSPGTYTVTYYAVKYDYQLDTNFNQPVSSGDFSMSHPGITVSSITGGGFVNGVMNVTFDIATGSGVEYIQSVNVPQSGGMGGSLTNNFQVMINVP